MLKAVKNEDFLVQTIGTKGYEKKTVNIKKRITGRVKDSTENSTASLLKFRILCPFSLTLQESQ